MTLREMCCRILHLTFNYIIHFANTSCITYYTILSSLRANNAGIK